MRTRLASLLLILCCALAPQENSPLSKIRAEFQDYVDRRQTAGTVTLVAHKGKVVSLEAVGWQDLEAKTPMKPDTLLREQYGTRRRKLHRYGNEEHERRQYEQEQRSNNDIKRSL